jgi:hypothetical protein
MDTARVGTIPNRPPRTELSEVPVPPRESGNNELRWSGPDRARVPDHTP